MEPMTLGSPSSPSSAQSSNFLPSYLMGEPNAITTPRTNTLSPTKGRTLAFGMYFVMMIHWRAVYIIKVLFQHHQRLHHPLVQQPILIDR